MGKICETRRGDLAEAGVGVEEAAGGDGGDEGRGRGFGMGGDGGEADVAGDVGDAGAVVGEVVDDEAEPVGGGGEGDVAEDFPGSKVKCVFNSFKDRNVLFLK